MARGGSLISRGLDLVVRTTGQLRPASLALGLQVLGLVGPLVVLVLVMVDRNRLDAFRALLDPGYPVTLEDQQLESAVGLGLFIALFGSTAILVEGRLIAAALMGGRLVDRPITLHEALRRSRQTFWRSIRAAFIVQVPITIIGSVLGSQVEMAGLDPFGGSILSGVVTTILTAPFAYATTGIVLGNVGAIESLRRSVRLARVRWRFALLVAFFAAIAQLLLVFGLSAGLDALARVSDFLGLGLSGGGPSTFGTLVVVLSAVVAIGTLVFTVNAVVVAPEVVAFVGLTGVTVGLDAARESAQGGGPVLADGAWGGRARARPVRWLSIPMGIGIALAILISVSGIAAVVRPS